MPGTKPHLNTTKSDKLRILAVHRYFWPDSPPYAYILKRLVERLHREGHCMEVITSKPSYREKAAQFSSSESVNGVSIRRLSLKSEKGKPIIRLLNAARLGSYILYRSLLRRYDVIIISTAPPILGGFFAALASKVVRSRFIYHCMDIHPEISKISGDFNNSLVFNFLRFIDNWTCKQANPIIVLSKDMENSLRRRASGKAYSIEIINNFNLSTESFSDKKSDIPIDKDILTVLFAGNIGRFQGLDIIVNAMTLLKERNDIEFIVMGDGVLKNTLQRKANIAGANVRFLNYQPLKVATAAMKEVDFGFVSLAPKMYRYAYPSKTMTYLAQGCPIIVAVEYESELSKDIMSGGYGFSIDVGDHKALANLLIELSLNHSWKPLMKEKAAKAADELYSESIFLDKWVQVINDGRR